jgi:hypothetical protein
MAKYDDASWHSGGDYPAGLPPENARTHIGFFLRWAFSRDLTGELHREEEPDAVAKVVQGTLSGAAFVSEFCDEKLTDEDLDDEGNAFAAACYDTYLARLTDLVCAGGKVATVYHAAEDEPTYADVARLLDEIYAEYERGARGA